MEVFFFLFTEVLSMEIFQNTVSFQIGPSIFIGAEYLACSCWKGAGGWAGVTQEMLLCDTGVAVTQGKLVRVATIKLLTPAKLLFAKASYQL